MFGPRSQNQPNRVVPSWDNLMLVFTGGRMAVNVSNGALEGVEARVACVSIQEMEEAAPVGSMQLTNTIGVKGPRLQMLFVKPESIDAMIHHLEIAKRALAGEPVMPAVPS